LPLLKFQPSCVQYRLILFFTLYFFVAQRPNLGLVRLIVEDARSHAISHTNRVRFLWMSDKPVAEAAINKTHDKHKWRISIPSTGFKPAIPAIQRRQTLHNTATGTGSSVFECL